MEDVEKYAALAKDESHTIMTFVFRTQNTREKNR
jgi:hypothetical protein